MRVQLNSSAVLKDRRHEKPAVDLILDSGAFSAWRMGKPVDLKAYTDFLLRHQHWITQSVALDVIEPGRPEDAARQGFENYQYMRKAGLRPIPVVHVGEHFDWMHRYLDAGVDYIGLSASSIVSRSRADDWYHSAWSELTDSTGKPVVKAHGFGEGRTGPLLTFPWQSCDTTTWIYSSQRAGTIQFGETNTRRLGFRNDSFATRGSPDIAQLAGAEKEYIDALLVRSGVSPDFVTRRDSKSAFITRCFLTAKFYQSIEERVNARVPISFLNSTGFFREPTVQRPAIHVERFNLYLVVGTNDYAWVVLARAKHPRILSSYFYLTSERSHNNLRDYIYDPIGFITLREPYAAVDALLRENLL